MKREAFEQRFESTWQRLEQTLAAKRNAQREELPALYRQVCHHLALARERGYGSDLELRLHRLVVRGHHTLYRRRGLKWRGVLGFLTAEFPARVRAEGGLAIAALALLFVPSLGMTAAVVTRPELVYTVLDGPAVAEVEAMYAQPLPQRAADSDVMMFGFYIWNNVGISFRTWASGIFLGLGSIFFLVYNGLIFGAVAGHLVNAGLADHFFPFVIGHGSLELTAIALAGLAGLKLGLAGVAPGRHSRRRALELAARSSLMLLGGVAAMLVAAAIVEAFWSASAAIPIPVKFAVGGFGWAAVAWGLAVGGRARAA